MEYMSDDIDDGIGVRFETEGIYYWAESQLPIPIIITIIIDTNIGYRCDWYR